MTTPRQRKLDLVWASVFLTVGGAWALTMIGAFAKNAPALEPAVAAFCFVLLLGAITIPLLLLFDSEGSALLTVGRVLIVLQVICAAGGVIAGIVS